MNPAPVNDRTTVSPEMTLALTRELLARSRDTLDALTRRLEGQEDRRDTPRATGSEAPGTNR